jgi:hypothetical protein
MSVAEKVRFVTRKDGSPMVRQIGPSCYLLTCPIFRALRRRLTVLDHRVSRGGSDRRRLLRGELQIRIVQWYVREDCVAIH